jgi:hypothetical protein
MDYRHSPRTGKRPDPWGGRDPFDDPFFRTNRTPLGAVLPTKREGLAFLGCGCLTIITDLVLLAIAAAIIVLVAKAVWG